MTKELLLKLALSFPNAISFNPERAVDDILQVSDATDFEQNVLLVIGYFESGWGKLLLGDCKDPSNRTIQTCKAFGTTQIQGATSWNKLATPERLIADRVLGYEVALKIFRYAHSVCKTTKGAISLYATGQSCKFTEIPTVKTRCKWIGC